MVAHRCAKARASAASDQKTLDLLRKVGPPPYRSLVAYRRFGDAFEPYKPAEDQAAVNELRKMLPKLNIRR